MRLSLVCGLALMVGCTCQPTLTGPKIEFSSMGTGDENALPLWPLEVGYRSLAQGVIDGVVESPYGKGVLYRAGSPESLDAQLFLKTEDGSIYFAGAIDVGLLDSPILLIPPKVRVGMKWTSKGSTGKPDTTAEVKSLETQDTKFGRQPVWLIEAIDQGTKQPFKFTWVEGLGETSATTVFFNPISATPPKKNVVTLEAMNSEVALGFTLDPSMVRLPDGRGWIIGGNPGSRGLCHTFDDKGIVKEPEVQTGNGPFATVTEPTCLLTSVCRLNINQVFICTSVGTSHASGIMFDAAGQMHMLPRGESGELIKTSESGIGVGAGSEFTSLGFFTADDGTVRRLDGDTGTVNGPMPLMARSIREFSVKDESGGTGLIFLANGLVWTARIGGPGSTQPEPGGAFVGKLSVLATPEGNQVLRVSADGQVDALRVNEGKLVVDHVADFALPPSEAPVGAWRWREPGGDRLIISTVTVGQVIGLVQHFYRSKDLLAAPTPFVIPPTLKLTRGTSVGGPFSCWPAGHAPATLREWNEGADVPYGAELVEGTNCGLIAGDRLVLPGIGHYLLDDDYDYGLQRGVDVGPWASLTGGGFISPGILYSAGGLAIGGSGLGGRVRDLNGNGMWGGGGSQLTLSGRSARVFADQSGSTSGVQILFAASGGGVVVSSDMGNYRVTPDGTWSRVGTPTMGGVGCSVTPDGTVCGHVPNGGTFCMPVDGPMRLDNTLQNGDTPTCGPVLPDGTFLRISHTITWHIQTDGRAVDIGRPPLEIGETLFETTDAEGTPWAIVRTTNNRWRAVRYDTRGMEVTSVYGDMNEPETPNWLNSIIVDRDYVLTNLLYGTPFFQPRP